MNNAVKNKHLKKVFFTLYILDELRIFHAVHIGT